MSEQPERSRVLSDLPVDELIVYGRELGLRLDPRMGQGELLRRVRERQDLLGAMDRQAMLDIMVWARRPVRKSASKEQLAREVATVSKVDFSDLSERGLAALARLRGLDVQEGEARALIEERIRTSEPLWERVRRRRRKWMGSLITKVVVGPTEDETEAYRFLPEDSSHPSLREQIQDEGVVGGIARKLRGVADDYVKQKLDEIEERIDRKLDEIDQRLAEWRDREVANRLRIIKITLIASVIVALLSYGYSYLNVVTSP